MKPARILIVDDEPLIRQSLAGVLEDEGYQTHAVATGEECCDEIDRAAYDLVLLDVWLARHGRPGDAGPPAGDPVRHLGPWW